MVEHRTLEREVRGLNLPPPCFVLDQDTLLPKVPVIPRKRWILPDMTEKLYTGTLSLNTNKQTNKTGWSVGISAVPQQTVEDQSDQGL